MPAWVIVKVWPPIAIVPVRAVAPVLAAAAKLTEPSPEPLAPAVIVNHAALLVAVQAQPSDDISAIDPVPPALATTWLVGEMA